MRWQGISWRLPPLWTCSIVSRVLPAGDNERSSCPTSIRFDDHAFLSRLVEAGICQKPSADRVILNGVDAMHVLLSESTATARIWPPLPRNHSLSSGQMRPVETARGDSRRHEKIASRKKDARRPQPAVSIPHLVMPSNGLRSARRRRRGGFACRRFAHHFLGADLPCRRLPDDFLRCRLLAG